MDYKQTAESIIKHIGGWDNVSHLEHCSTRLRFTFDVSIHNFYYNSFNIRTFGF